MNILLASSSLYRRKLLERFRISFDVFSPDIDESRLDEEDYKTFIKRIATQKGDAARAKYPNHIIISADSVALCEGSILGKPLEHAKAVEQLKYISGKKVSFLTGLCLSSPSHEKQYELVDCHVYFKQLSENTIEGYLKKDEPYFSAGSFKFESLGMALIDRFEGNDPTGVEGLPLIALVKMLDNFGYPIIPNVDNCTA